MLKTDSRNINNRDIFVAIKGSHADGNNYVKDALKAGASMAVTEKTFNDPAVITVSDTVKSLSRLGHYFRTRSNLSTVIGITGSCGKTTTRNWLYSVLSKYNNALQSMHNYNTMLSMALNFEQLQYDTEIGIFELGTNSVGEIFPLTRYVKPNISIITNIYEAHIGNFKNIDELVNEKLSIIEGMQQHGVLLYDGDSEFKDKILNKCSINNVTPVSIGYNENCDYKVNTRRDITTITTKDNIYKYSLKTPGRHYSYISAIVVAVLEKMGLDVERYIDIIKNLVPLRGRGSVNEYKYSGKRIKVIDETYNASPSAVIATLDCLRQNAENKVLVIGEMLELGNKSLEYHEKIAQKLSEFSSNKIYFVGSKNLWGCIQKYTDIKCFERITENVITEILNNVQDGDILYLKGSRGIALDKILNSINVFQLNT